MKAGRELDALIAENVMGWKYESVLGRELMRSPDGFIEATPNYSTNMADAWLIVEKFRKEGTFLSVVPQIDDYAVYGWCNVGESDPHKTYPICMIESETSPLAICLAALKACGVEVEG